MQNNNEDRANKIASEFANRMSMAGWEPQGSFIEALAREITAAMDYEQSEADEGYHTRADLIDALQYAAQRIEF